MSQKPGTWGTRPPNERRRKGGLGGFRAQLHHKGHQWTREEGAAAGRKRAANQTPEERSAHARAAANMRWSKRALIRTKGQAKADSKLKGDA